MQPQLRTKRKGDDDDDDADLTHSFASRLAIRDETSHHRSSKLRRRKTSPTKRKCEVEVKSEDDTDNNDNNNTNVMTDASSPSSSSSGSQQRRKVMSSVEVLASQLHDMDKHTWEQVISPTQTIRPFLLSLALRQRGLKIASTTEGNLQVLIDALQNKMP